MSEQKLASVALLLLNKRGEVYAIRELVSKPAIGKVSGSLSFPWETLEEGELPADAIKRLVLEEVDGMGEVLHSEVQYLGRLETHVADIHVYVTQYEGPEEAHFFGSHAGFEFTPMGFISVETLLLYGRWGVAEVIGLWRGLDEICTA